MKPEDTGFKSGRCNRGVSPVSVGSGRGLNLGIVSELVEMPSKIVSYSSASFSQQHLTQSNATENVIL